MASKNKRKKTKNKNGNNLQGESKKLDSLPPKQDLKTETEKLFEKVKAKVEAIKAATTTNACSIPFHDISASTPEKAYPLEKKIENGGPDDLPDLPNVSQRAEMTADAGPLLVGNRVQDLLNIKKKKKKKTTAAIKIRTLRKQIHNISSIVRCCPTCFDPVQESLRQVLPEYKDPQPVSNSGSNPKIFKCENDNSTVLKPKNKKMKKKKKKKATNIQIQTLLEQYNIKLESLPEKQDPISKKDLEKLLEEVKVNTEAVKAAGNTNATNIPFYDMSASTPDKAYPLEKIIEKEEWDCLGDLLNIPQGEKLTPEAYPIFVCNRVQKLEDMKDEYEKRTVASVLQYITHLIKYKEKHSLHGYELAKNHKFPSILEEKFRAMFNESSSKILSSGKRKLLINYVLVLALFVDGYQSDASDIAKDLRTDVIEVITQYKLLGCKIDHEKPAVVTLPVPLKFTFKQKKKKKDQQEVKNL